MISWTTQVVSSVLVESSFYDAFSATVMDGWRVGHFISRCFASQMDTFDMINVAATSIKHQSLW